MSAKGRNYCVHVFNLARASVVCQHFSPLPLPSYSFNSLKIGEMQEDIKRKAEMIVVKRGLWPRESGEIIFHSFLARTLAPFTVIVYYNYCGS